MAERIDLPPTLQGDEKAQLQQVWSYLYQLSEAINNNLEAIGGNDLTDSERMSMQQILQAAGVSQDEVSSEYETLKSLIIKTADFVQTSLQEYRMVLFGETVASSQFGQVNRRTGMDVAVTPDGVLQKFSLREIVKDLKTYEVNAKNYIKTGYLRTENSIPVYGVAIGKDVVTFSADGTETYNDGNKVAELTADELSFWQNNVKIAKYTGSRISFLYNGTEAFYIQNGKWYAVGDMEITNGKKLILASGADMEVSSGGDLIVKSGGTMMVQNSSNNNIIKMSNAGLDVESGGTVTVKSGGNMTIKSGGTFAVKNSSNNNVIKMSNTGLDVESGGDIKIKSGGSFQVQSGGTFDVQATNFQINSANKYMQTGNWKFYNKGAKYTSGSNEYLISDDTSEKTNNTRGAVLFNMTSNGGEVRLYAKKANENTAGELIYGTSDNAFNYLYSNGTILGNSANPFVFFYGQHFVGRPTYINSQSYNARQMDLVFDQNLDVEHPTPTKILSFYSYYNDSNNEIHIIGSGKIVFHSYVDVPTLYYDYLVQKSSRYLKDNIKKMESVGDKLDKLEPVTFTYKSDQTGKRRAGLIYEDTVNVMPEVCVENNGERAINYVEMIPMLLKEIQDLRARVKALEER